MKNGLIRIASISAVVLLNGCQKEPVSVPVGWEAVKLAVDENKFDMAAEKAVGELSGDYPSRSYAMWKWWEHTFGEQKDYDILSKQFGKSLFSLYDRSEPASRLVIIEIFSRPDFDISRSGADLQTEVEGKPRK